MSLVILLSTWMSSAHAWTINTNSQGIELGWSGGQIGWTLNTTGAHGLDLHALTSSIESAAGQWNGVEDSRVDLDYLGPTTVAAADYTDGQNTIYFEHDWDLDPVLLAVTYVWSLEDGTITAFDMAINTADHVWSTDGDVDENDLHNTVTHEFGHSLGLAHSSLTEASMYESTYEGETSKRDISVDDEHGMRYLYSEAAYGKSTTSSSSGVGCSSIPAPSRLGWLALLAVIPAILRRP